MSDKDTIRALVEAFGGSIYSAQKCEAAIAQGKAALASPAQTEAEWLAEFEGLLDDYVGKVDDRRFDRDDVRAAEKRLYAHVHARPAPEGADTKRLGWMEKNLLRDATIRLGNGDLKSVNAWAISSENKNLREAIDAVIAAQEGAKS